MGGSRFVSAIAGEEATSRLRLKACFLKESILAVYSLDTSFPVGAKYMCADIWGRVTGRLSLRMA